MKQADSTFSTNQHSLVIILLWPCHCVIIWWRPSNPTPTPSSTLYLKRPSFDQNEPGSDSNEELHLCLARRGKWSN